MRVISVIEEGPVALKILDFLGLPCVAAVLAPCSAWPRHR